MRLKGPPFIFSRRVMKWNATNIVTLFFYPHELTKIVLQKFYKILLHQNALFGLANWTKKVFLVFPRNIPYRARPKTPPFIFFGTARLFSKKIPQMVPPAFFWCFATEWMLKNPKGSPFQFFSALWDFFPKMKIFVFFNFFMFCDRMDVEKPQRVPPFSFSELWDFSEPVGPFFWVCNFFETFFQKNSILEYCKRVLDTWKSFCYFWALDMAPTWAGPGLFFAIARLFQEKNFLKGPPFDFLMLGDRKDVEKTQRTPLLIFSALRLFSKKNFPFQFFDVLQQWMLKNPKGSPRS